MDLRAWRTKTSKIDSVGNLVCVIMDDENADYYLENFAQIAVAGKRAMKKPQPSGCGFCVWTDGRCLFGAAVIPPVIAAPERSPSCQSRVVDCLLKRAAVVGLADADARVFRPVPNAMEVDRISLFVPNGVRLPGNGSCAVMWMPQESYTSV